ncbi:MAG: hypothetical protein ACUVTR_06520 [Dehalococcoidia bacterium]
MLIPALEGKTTQAETATELGLSPSHASRLARMVTEVGGGYESLSILPAQPSCPNKLPGI